jgi:hypothetical protein
MPNAKPYAHIPNRTTHQGNSNIPSKLSWGEEIPANIAFRCFQTIHPNKAVARTVDPNIQIWSDRPASCSE